MDKIKICRKYSDYKNCEMSAFEFNKELVYQKWLYEKYQNELNLVVLFFIALISIGVALYALDDEKMDIIIQVLTIILGALLGANINT